MKLLKIIAAASLVVSISSVSLSADVVKGQKLFVKKLKDKCGMAGDKFAAKHSMDEWEEIMENGEFMNEIKKICPSVQDSDVKESWIPHFYDFSYEYANDSGNVPSC
ncbi:MAG: cytochrome C [Sulfurovum sp.]